MFSVDCHCVVTSNVLNLIARAKSPVSVIPKKENSKKSRTEFNQRFHSTIL